MNKIKKKEFERKFQANVLGYEIKTLDDGNLVVRGYIATSHLDTGFYDYNSEKFTRDKISKETLMKWADDVNKGIPRVNKVSVNHMRESHVSGVGIKGTARVDMLPDGEYGLYVESLLDKTKEGFEDIEYRIKNDLLDSFSIEFTARDALTSDYISGAVKEESSGEGVIRTLLPGTELEGWTLASQPMNPHAVMLKEILSTAKANIKNNKEVINMTDEIKEKIPLEKKEEEEVLEAPKEEAPVEPEAPAEEAKETLTSEDKKLLKEYKEQKMAEKKESEYKEIVSKVKEDLKESLKKVEVENKVSINKNLENKELADFKESVKMDSKISVDAQFAMAGKIADATGLSIGELKTDSARAEARQYKNFSTNGTKLEYKGLGITTNQNTDTDYLLSAAELRDVFDPVIFNMLNQKTMSWNLFSKDDFSSKGNNQVQFSGKTAANTTASSYTGNAVSTGNVSRLKFMTKFKKYQVGVEVDGDMIAAARGGPIGDVFAQEVRDSVDDLMAVINAALFAEVGLETAAGVIGFEYITDVTGNTSLYNLTRSTTNLLSPASAGDTYIDGSSADVSIANLRAAIRQPVEEGADRNNLVFICSPIQYDKIKGIYDAAQRLVPISSRFGFEGLMEFDGIPVFYDKDCNDDDIFLIDLETHRIAMWVPPTLEMLGKDSDSQKGFIKTYFATYNRAPRRMVQIYGNATS